MVVSATPARCFEVSSDIGSYPQWAADIKEVTIDERDEQGRPKLVTFRAAAFGRSTNYTLAYDYSEAPEVLAWVQTQGDITSKLDGRYVFAPKTLRKHHKLTSELICFSNTFVYYHVHHVDC
jgi:hypothetical protein